MQTLINPKSRRSEKMTQQELILFRRYAYSFSTQVDAAHDLGVSRITLQNVLAKGSGKPSTVEMIRSRINC